MKKLTLTDGARIAIGLTLLIIVLGAIVAMADTVEVSKAQLEAGGIVVSNYTLSITPPVVCKYPEYAGGDKDRNGYLDNACDISYNPCDHDSIAEAYNKWQQSGISCKNQINCAGLNFSPPPEECQ